MKQAYPNEEDQGLVELPLHAFKYDTRQLYCPQTMKFDGYG